MTKSLIAGLLILVSQPAIAQGVHQKLTQAARASARLLLIEPICGPSYNLDLRLLDALRTKVTVEGVETFGLGTFRDARKKVEPELIAEVAKGGASAWCPAQRKRYKALRAPEFIGGLRQ